jgi:hypothetical protein
MDDGWYLGDLSGSAKEAYDLAIGIEVNVDKYKDLTIEVFEGKIQADYSESIQAVSIISGALADALYEFGDDIQLIPVKQEPAPQGEENYYVVVFKRAEDCVEETSSDFGLYNEKDAPSPDRIGHYKYFSKLKVDPTRIGSAIFRLAKYKPWIIVNEKVKKSLSDKGFTGFAFTPISV